MPITEGSPIARFTPQVTESYIPVPFQEFYQLGLQYEKQKQDILNTASESSKTLLGINALDYVVTSTGKQYKVGDRDYLQKMTHELQNEINEKSNDFVTGKIKIDEFKNYVREKSQQINTFKNTVGAKLQDSYNQEQSRQKSLLELKDSNVRQDRFLQFDNSARVYGMKGGAFGGATLSANPIGEAKDIYKELDARAKDIPMMITKSNPGSLSYNAMGVEKRKDLMRSNTFKLKDTFDAYWNTDLSNTIRGGVIDEIENIKENAYFTGDKPEFRIGEKKYSEQEYLNNRLNAYKSQYQSYFYNKASENDLDSSFDFTFLPEWVANKDKEKQNDGMINTMGFGIPEESPFQVNREVTDDGTFSYQAKGFIDKITNASKVSQQLLKEGYMAYQDGTFGKNGKPITEKEFRDRENQLKQGIKQVEDTPFKPQLDHLVKSVDLSQYGYHDNREVATKLKQILSKPLIFSEAPINMQPEMAEITRKQLRADLNKRLFDFSIDGKKYENTSFSKLLEELGIDDVNDVMDKMSIEPSSVYLATMKKNAEGGSIGGYMTIPGVKKLISFKAPMDKNFTFATMPYQNMVSNSYWQGIDTYTKDNPKTEPIFDFNGKQVYQKWYTTTIPNKDYDPDKNDGGLVHPFHVVVNRKYFDAKTDAEIKEFSSEKSLEKVKAEFIEQLNESAKRTLNSTRGYSKGDVNKH